MSSLSNVVTTKRLTQASLLVVGLVIAGSVFAAGGLTGGLSQAQTAATQIQTALLTIAGIVAVIYLLYKALQAWQGRCDWGEFGMSVLYVALAGGAATLAKWAWELLQ